MSTVFKNRLYILSRKRQEMNISQAFRELCCFHFVPVYRRVRYRCFAAFITIDCMFQSTEHQGGTRGGYDQTSLFVTRKNE